MAKKFNHQFRVGQGGIKQATGDIALEPGEDQHVEVDATTRPVIVTLQRADGWGGKKICIKKVDSSTNLVTIQGSGSQIIDGLTSVELSSEQQGINLISDGENWATIGETTGSTASLVKDFLAGELSVIQNSNVGDNDHVKFDSVLESSGVKSVLDTATAYTNSLNVDSIGRITLLAGFTYKLTGLTRTSFPASGGGTLVFRNADSGDDIGPQVSNSGPANAANSTIGNVIIAIFKPSVDTRIELKIVAGGNQSSFAANNTTILIEQI